VLALGGITTDRVPAVRARGFDGIAVIGAVWQAPDPLRAFAELQESLCCHAA
jgi:thiamine-phosphate pyrophosphorylase